MVQVEPNMYFSDLSSASEGSLGRLEESETSSRSTQARSTRCQKTRRKFDKRMNFFLQGGGSCSYDDEIVGDINFPLRYKHLVKKWVLSDLPKVPSLEEDKYEKYMFRSTCTMARKKHGK